MNTTDQEVTQFYCNIVQDPHKLANGYKLITQYLLSSSKRRQYTLINLLNSEVPVLTLVKQIYPLEIMTNQTVTVEEKISTRRYLISNLLRNELYRCPTNIENIEKIYEFINKIHLVEGYQLWIQLYEQILTAMTLQNNKNIGILFLGALRQCDDRVHILSRHLLVYLMDHLHLFSQQQCIEILYYCVKSMAFMKGTQDQVLQQYFQPYRNIIIQLIIDRILGSILTVKYGLKLLTILCGDYQIDIQSVSSTIKQICSFLLTKYCQELQNSIVGQCFEDDLDDNHPNTTAFVLYQLLQLVETTGIQLLQAQLNALMLYISVILSLSSYKYYQNYTHIYLLQVEDEGKKSVRNRAIQFLATILEEQKQTSLIISIFQQHIHQTILQSSNNTHTLSKIFQIQNINLNLNSVQLQIQAVLFILYSFTSELISQSFRISCLKALSMRIQNHQELYNILALNIVTKMVQQYQYPQQQYYQFILRIIPLYMQNMGMLLSICKAFISISTKIKLLISLQDNKQYLPSIMVSILIEFAVSIQQSESGCKVLQFLKSLISNVQNILILQKLMNDKQQIQLLLKYMCDGMSVSILIDVLAVLATQKCISMVFLQFQKGNIKDDTLSKLMNRWLHTNKIVLSQEYIIKLINIYHNNIQFISSIIKQYITVRPVSEHSSQFLVLLNKFLHNQWVLPMLKSRLISDPAQLLIYNVSKITYELTSQYQIQCMLLLPYYCLLNQTQNTITLLRNANLYDQFLEKLIKYAYLFQGQHLRIMTIHVAIKIILLDDKNQNLFLNLVHSYTNLQVEEWQDEEKSDQDPFEALMGLKISNDEVQAQFVQAFGNLAWQMPKI